MPAEFSSGPSRRIAFLGPGHARCNFRPRWPLRGPPIVEQAQDASKAFARSRTTSPPGGWACNERAARGRSTCKAILKTTSHLRGPAAAIRRPNGPMKAAGVTPLAIQCLGGGEGVRNNAGCGLWRFWRKVSAEASSSRRRQQGQQVQNRAASQGRLPPRSIHSVKMRLDPVKPRAHARKTVLLGRETKRNGGACGGAAR